MKWTKAQEDKLIKLISEHKKKGYEDAEIYRLISKTMKRTPNALRHKHGSIKAELMNAEFVDHMASLDGDLADFDEKYHDAIYKQKIGRALRVVDKKPLIIDMADASLSDIEKAKWALGNNFDQEAYQAGFDRVINPPISCDAGAVNYTNEPKIEKPKSFIEKVLAFFKGGKDE